MLFEKSGNFSQSEHRDRFDSFPPPVYFRLLFKDHPPPSTTNPGFPTGVENMGGGSPSMEVETLQNLIGGGLKSINGGSMGWG